MRITGIASGMDIDQMVSDLMKAERKRVDKVEQSKQISLWRQEMYNDFNKSFAEFILQTKQDFGLTKTSASGSLINASVNSLDWVRQASLSDSSVADVNVQASAAEGSYNIKVTALAANWSAASASNISIGDKTNLGTQLGLDASAVINFTITTDQGSVTINKTGQNTMTELVKAINDAKIGVTASYDSTADRFFLQTTQTGSNHTVKIVDNSTVNDASGNPVRMNFITGADSLLKLQDGAGQNVLDNTSYTGTDAVIDFGAAKNIVQHSNTFMVNGINFMLKKTGSFSVDVTSNVNAIYDKIKNFVDKYNALLDKMSDKLNEKRYRDYLPLTQDQKDAMKDKEIELWEEKAKSGLLRNDSILERTYQSMRQGFYEEVAGTTGAFNHLTEIGITTETYAIGSRGGKLVIDKEKLTAAITKDANGVLELLFKEPSTELKSKSESTMTREEILQKRSESGLISRLYDNIVAGMKDVVVKAGTGENTSLYKSVNSMILVDFVTKNGSISMLDKEITDYNKKIEDLNDYLTKTENRYYEQFTAMEKALNQMNQQSSWLAQQFSK